MNQPLLLAMRLMNRFNRFCDLHGSRAVWIGVACLAGLSCTRSSVSAEPLRIAWFQEDVTVPLGHRLMGILPTKSQSVADPLEARGLVLLGHGEPIVVVAIDWCEIRGEAYDRWRDVLAGAAGTTRQRVLVSSLHQHDAPVADLGAERLLSEVGLAGELCDAAFHEDAVQRVAARLRVSLSRARRVTHVGIGKAKVEQVASSRRVVMPDGRVVFHRGSNSGGNELFRSAPEGEIDPWLRTISFWEDETPLVALSAYATHPMSYYGRGEVSADFVGLARRLRAKDDPRIFNIYVSGCSGDVTAGKYNDGSPENRPRLADRLLAAMRKAWTETERSPVQQVTWRAVEMTLPFREGDAYLAESLEHVLADPKQDVRDRILAAMGLASRQRLARGITVLVPAVDWGPAIYLQLPGESFVGYQLMAQELRPDVTLVCSGYGECWTGYIPTRAALRDSFDDVWRWVGPGAENELETAIRDVLKPGEPQ